MYSQYCRALHEAQSGHAHLALPSAVVCGHFYTQREAQSFYEQWGMPYRDPHNLDGERDGVACKNLP